MSKKRFPEQGSDKGEERIKRDGKEPGRYDEKTDKGRPAGKSTARDSTGVNPKEPIDPRSPTMIPE